MGTNTVDITYIGNNPHMNDVVNNTGITWLKGETQPYPSHLASKLLHHTDTWELADGRQQSTVAKAGEETKPEKKQDEDEVEMLAKYDLSEMTKKDMVILAKREFGIDLDMKLRADDMRSSINKEIAGRGGRG